MFRVLNAVSVIALLAAAGAVYQVKYSAAFEAQKIAKVRSEIRAERDRIAILNAEWARRTAPDRIQALAENHLDMQPLDVAHMDVLASLPAKPEPQGDVLGGMIEALVDGPSPAGSGAEATRQSSKPVSKMPAPKPGRLPPDAPLAESSATGVELSGVPLPLSAVPSAGNMAPRRPQFTGPQGALGAPLNPAASTPLLPPGTVGQ
ncbi:cell division protein FtsL [Ancylobacter pratisalsi]|uniref:Cell division protein FtsL n=1 Tax=Ancylobacter pratisalsi TaxID=1745854 RepID=A0A6P1YJA0_9HYPH|nr:hypothetical protein [Ancylobacter pratisalsi]QIB33457.1 hypothetical protein G3A50_06865 [Ancylobacter pratisalsi]